MSCIEQCAGLHVFRAEELASFSAFFAHYADLSYLVFNEEIAAVTAVAEYFAFLTQVAKHKEDHIPYVLVVVEVFFVALVLLVDLRKLCVVDDLGETLVRFFYSLEDRAL